MVQRIIKWIRRGVLLCWGVVVGIPVAIHFIFCWGNPIYGSVNIYLNLHPLASPPEIPWFYFMYYHIYTSPIRDSIGVFLSVVVVGLLGQLYLQEGIIKK